MRQKDVLDIVQKGRAVASYAVVHAKELGVSSKAARAMGRMFLLDPEIDLARTLGITLPPPRPFPAVSYRENSDGSMAKVVRPSRRWGSSDDAKSRIEFWLRKGFRVGLLAGKFRVLNYGELDALAKGIARVDKFMVAVSSHDMCLVDQERADVQFIPSLSRRMQQLADTRFAQGRTIDFLFEHTMDPLLLAGEHKIPFIPFYFLNMPDFQSQSDGLLSRASIQPSPYWLDEWMPIIARHQPTWDERNLHDKFRWFITKDRKHTRAIDNRAGIFSLMGGRSTYLPQHRFGDRISSTEIIKRWNVAPDTHVRIQFVRHEQMTPEDLHFLHEAKKLSRSMIYNE